MHTTSTYESKNEEGIHQEIKNDNEIELNTKNKITAIGALVVPVLSYSFVIINWRLEEIRKLDTTTIKIVKLYKLYHPKADRDRLYVKKKRRRKRPVTNWSDVLYKEGVINIAEYLNIKYAEDLFVNIKNHNSIQPNMNWTTKRAVKDAVEFNHSNENSDKKKRRHSTHKSKIMRVLKEKMEKQSNAWPVY